MSGPFDKSATRAIRSALARDAYERNIVRISDPDVRGYDWLVAANKGVFAVADGGFKTVIHGWFFGIHRVDSTIYLFENCALRNAAAKRGRIVRVELVDGRLGAPAILATGLDNHCHQLALIDGLLCLVETTNQGVRRFTLDGTMVDFQQVLPPALMTDTSGAYAHINSIARVGDRIGLLLHNGKVVPETSSELAWFDRDWTLLSREPLPGRCCHDIVEDEQGRLWHCDSMAGDVFSSDGQRVKVTSERMTRGIAFRPDAAIVGVSIFGQRDARQRLGGAVVIFDRDFQRQTDIELPGAPNDIVAL